MQLEKVSERRPWASRDERLRALVDVQQALVTAAEPGAAGRIVVEQVPALTNATGATLGVLEGTELVFAAASGVLAEHAGLRLAREDQLPPGGLLAGRVVRSADLQREGGALAAWRGSGARGAVAVPIGRGRDVSGVLLVVTEHAEHVDETCLDVLRLVAGTLALLLGTGRGDGEGDHSDGFRCSPVPLALLDARGRIQQVNDAACELFGYSQQELQLVGLEALLCEDDRADDREAVRQVQDCERRSVSRLTRIKTRRGEELSVIAGARLLRERSGRVVGMLRSFSDVGPELARIERQSRTASSGAVARLAASTAHALNGKLGSVLSSLGGISETARPPRPLVDAQAVRELTKEALEAAREMQTWVRELRTLANVDERKRKPIDVRQALDTAAGLAVEEIRERAKLLRDYREVPGVDAVEPHLVQLLTQLLLEAVHSLPPGSADASELRLSTWSEDGRAVVEICDRTAGKRNGAADHSMLLGQAVRLGMPLLHGLVDAMGGVLDVQTEGAERRMRLELPGTEPRS